MNRSVRSLLVACTAALLVALVASSVPPMRAASAESKPQASKLAPVDVNRATAAELVAVPGIGKSLAQRIVDFREKNGPYGKVDDLLKVQGVGEKSLERIRPYLTVGKSN